MSKFHYALRITHCALLFAAVIFFAMTPAQAYGIFWYDMSSDIPLWKKVVIFPLANSNDKNTYLISRDEESLLYWENKHLMERFEKKIKNLHTVRLAPGIKEKDEILVDKFSILLDPYPDERTRGAAVFEQTGADMYLLPRFKQNRIQTDISPRTEFNVQLSSWTEISGSQNSDGTYDKRTWTEHHVIPQKEIYLHIMELEFEGYDTENGKKVLLFTDARREYNVDEKHQFRNITKYIRKDFGEMKSGKHKDADKAGKTKIGFQDLQLPASIRGDEYSLKGAYFGMKFEAMDKLKGVSVITDATSDKTPDYYVTGTVERWEMISTWNPPRVTTYSSLVETTEKDWYDNKGKKHTMKTKKYEEKITDHYAYWSFQWNVRATFRLVNAKTGQVVVSDGGDVFDDKPMDAYRSILRSFYAKVNTYFNK